MPVFDAGVFDSNVLDAAVVGDTTPPILDITVAPTRTKISAQTGVNVTTFTFTANEDYQGYQLRAVPADNSLVSAGTLIESGSGGSSGVARQVDVTSAELQAAGLSGALRVKVFGQDAAGNWSI